jgi:hypothetical protein
MDTPEGSLFETGLERGIGSFCSETRAGRAVIREPARSGS